MEEIGDFGAYDDADAEYDGGAGWDGADADYGVDAADSAASAGGVVGIQRAESGSSTGAPPSAAFILGTAVGAIQSDFGVELELSGFVDLSALSDVARIAVVDSADLGLTPPASVSIAMLLTREDTGGEPSFRPAATMWSGETGPMSGVIQARTGVRIAELACKVADATSREAAIEALSQEFKGFRTEGSHLKGTAKAAVEDDRQHAEALLELLPARIWRAGPGAGLPARRVLLTAAVLLREYARGRLCRVCCKRVPRDARWCAAELCLYAGITLPAYHTPHLHMPGAAPFVRAAAGAALAVMSNASHTRSGVYNGAAAGAVAEVTATANAARDALLMPVPVDYQVVIDGAAATGAAASSAAATSAAAAGGAGAAVAATSSASAGGRAAAAAASIKTVNVAQLSADLASLLLRGPSLASATTPAAMVRWAMSEPDERYLPKAPPPEVGDGAVVVDAADTSAAAGSSATAVASAAVPAAGAAAGGAGARAAAAAVPPSGAAAAAVAGSMADSMTAQQATRAAVVELSRAPEHARRLVALVWWLLNSPRCRYRVLTPAEDAFAAAAANAAAPVPEAAARGWAGAAASEGAAAAPSLLFPSFDRAAGHYSYSHSSSGSGSSSAAAGEAVETVVVALEDEAVEARMAALPAGDPGAGEPYAGQGTAEKPPSSWIARPCTLWHGMPASRAFSVVRNGLFVFSNTSWMLVGATYGAGIYSSNSTATCAGYSPAASAVVSVPELTAINDATAAAAEAAYRESIGAGAPLASGSGIGSSSLSSDGRLPSYVGPPPTMHVTVPAGNMARLFVAPYCAVKGTENIYVVKRENRFRITHLLLAVPTVKVAGMLPR